MTGVALDAAVRTSRRMRWLVTLVGLGLAAAVPVLVSDVDAAAHAGAGARAVVEVAGLTWLVLLVVVTVGVCRSMLAARRLLAAEPSIGWIGDTSRDWLWESDTELRLTYCSPRVSEQLGYTADELLGRTLFSLLTPDDERRARDIVADAVANGTGWQDVELTWTHAQGHLVTLQGTSTPIVSPGGKVTGFHGTRRPVGDAVAAERVVAVRLRLIDMLRDGAVDVALQPIVSVVTGRMVGAEALARFRDGRGPEAWFAEARSIGFGLELDRLCFSAALDLLPVLPPDVSLSVNTSPELLVDPAFQQLLTGPDVDLSRLVVEVTEHVEIGRYDDIRAALLPVRERGLRLAVDDTGAGYASFSHVLQLRPDIIKIDRSLVSNVTTDPARRSLLTALVLLALDLGATVTAEGVEDRSELETLAALGVDEAQGYFLARPTTDPVRWARWSERTWHQLDPEPAPSVTIT